MEIIALIVLILVGLIAIAAIGMVLARLYHRATREVAFVRTGSGGRRVVIDGGAIVIPLLHEVARVNLRTTRLEVRRTGEDALITKDRLRVDSGVEFFVVVKPDVEGISCAAQTLGARTFDPEELRTMVEGKLVDGLRAVAAKMTMDELHEQRAEFVQSVQAAVEQDLLKNGLQLEAVSLTMLDQTPFDKLDENNAFNAVGMRALAERIAESKRARAQVEAETETSIRETRLAAAKRQMELERQEQIARIAEETELETKRAEQEAELSARREESRRAQTEAKILADASTEAAEIRKIRDIEMAQQDRQIAIAEKSRAESEARAAADEARAAAVKAEAGVVTAREVAEAERRKQIALIAAAEAAEREAVKINLAAKAEREAAVDRAQAILEAARAEAESIEIKAAASKVAALAEAEGRQALIAAENAMSAEVMAFKAALSKLDRLPEIVTAMAKPAERIESIRINQISGLGGPTKGADDNIGHVGNGGSVIDQAFAAMGSAAVSMPALQALGKELGMTFDRGVSGLVEDLDQPIGQLGDQHPNGARDGSPS